MKIVIMTFLLTIMTTATITVIDLTPTIHADNSKIKAFCQNKWPDNYRMQKHCIDKQIESNQSIWQYIRKHNLKGGPDDDLSNPYAKILHQCLRKWKEPDFDTYNYRMVDHCIKKQVEAYEQIK